jgi:hypothetical protein
VHVRTITVSLGALALTFTIAGCSAAAQHGQAASTTPSTSTSAPAATPATGTTGATQGCSPGPQGYTIADASSLLVGNGYSPVNSLVSTSQFYQIDGGALGQDSTGAQAVLFPPSGEEPAAFAESLNSSAADHGSPVKAAPSTCVYNAAVTVTGGKADVVTLLSEDGIDLEPLSGIVTPGPSPTQAAAAPSPSATVCFTPDIAGDNATAARSAVQTAGFQVAVVTKADPDEPSFPGGLVWGGNPPLDETKAPCGSTVTVYIQPGTTP